MTQAPAETVGASIGERVKWARERLKLGVNELDRRIGQGSGYTSRLERGEKLHPRRELVERIAHELGVRAEWLLFGSGDLFPTTQAVPERIAAIARGVPAATPADVHLVIEHVGLQVLDSVADTALARLIEEASHFRRVAAECIELDSFRRKSAPPPTRGTRRRPRGG